MSKANISFPILSNKQGIFPEASTCSLCNKEKVAEPHSFAVLSGGALLMEPAGDTGGPDDNMEGYLSILWHGVHGEGEGEHQEIYKKIDVVEDLVSGQFDIYFCSTKCLRGFLNEMVDKLEERIEQKKL